MIDPLNSNTARMTEEVLLNGFYPIGLDFLFLERFAPCDLFRKLESNEFVFFARKAIPFDRSARESLEAHGVRQLYIRDEDVPAFFGCIRETLTAVARDPGAHPRTKARTVHAACGEILRRVYEEPRASFINLAREIVAPIVNLIVSDDDATHWLIRLTAYDHSTYTHSTNVGIFSVVLAKLLFGRKTTHDMERLGAGFFLHDLGKCNIPLEILNKPGPLTPEEREIINRHPEDGFRMLREGGLMTEEARIITLQHHEREDGKGYPLGLRGEEIHPYARICRLADVYEALTAERPYHRRRSTFAALKFMKEEILTDVDSALMGKFIALFSS